MTLKITTITTALASAATAGAVGVVGAPIASAEDVTTQSIGSQAKLNDGNVVQGWTISNLKPSSDAIPYPVSGTLWEATATDEAIQGSATPIVSNLNARTGDGQTYRALFGAATPEGVNPSTLAQGQKTSGKVYFDVTGTSPTSVVYIAGGQDMLAWVQSAPSPSQAGTQGAPTPRSQTTTYPAGTPLRADTPATPVQAAADAAPAPAAADMAPVPAVSQGTPLPAVSQGTPLPAGSQGTPLPAGSQGTPLPAGSQGTPPPAGSEGAPMPPAVQGTPVPAQSPAAPTTTTVAPAPPAR
jgi:hypothetical protein